MRGWAAWNPIATLERDRLQYLVDPIGISQALPRTYCTNQYTISRPGTGDLVVRAQVQQEDRRLALAIVNSPAEMALHQVQECHEMVAILWRRQRPSVVGNALKLVDAETWALRQCHHER